jgi:hypothetical protein
MLLTPGVPDKVDFGFWIGEAPPSFNPKSKIQNPKLGGVCYNTADAIRR